MKDVELFIVTGSIITLLFVAFIVSFLLINQKKHFTYLKEKETLQNNFQQAILQTQIEIQEQTLKTISQEIHDNIGQVLTLAKLNLNTLKINEEIKLNDTKHLVSKALNDLRDLSRSMHGDKIVELGLCESIGNELKILQNTGQFKTQLTITGEVYKQEQQKEMVLFRMVQESLNNALKHSQAKNIKVAVYYQPQKISLHISDDGKGFSVDTLLSSQTGIGLKSMQNRAALIGCRFSIDSSPGNGTTVTIIISNPST